MLLVFYGRGKGKTSAALGTVLRALGHGFKVLVIQFMKSSDSGEYLFYRKLINCGCGLGSNIRWYSVGTREFVNVNDLGNEVASITIAKSVGFLLHIYPAIVNDFKPDLTLFDELGLATHLGLLPEDLTLDVLSRYSGNEDKHAIVTGRYVPKSIRDIADLITNCNEVRHYFLKGFTNIKGLDI